ncbi:hypothetical protein GQR58_019046 [Nymphon striatum]|nr:hypothetical protein GQR58_019046 [Nymphon striatum]
MKYIFAVVFMVITQYAAVNCADTRYERSMDRALERVRRQAPGSIDDYLKTVLNNFKSQMTTGIPALKIPKLDPFNVKDQSLVKKGKNFDIKATLKNNYVTGLSKFQIEKLHLDLNTLQFEFGLHIPNLAIEGLYTLNGKALNIFPIYGNGEYSVTVKNLKISTHVKVTIDANGKGTLAEPPNLDVGFSSVSVNFENLLGGLSNVLNGIINAVAKPVFKKFEPKLMKSLKKSLFKVLNKQLSKIDISKFF